MIEIIKSLLLDFLEMPLFTGVPRRFGLAAVEGKASVCIGVRRCGKSTFMHQVIQRLLEEGVARENILYLNFFDDRLHGLNDSNLGAILEAYFSLYPEKKNTERVYCFFDEIQNVPGWEPFINRLMRTENCQVYITGSSAHMLSREIATQMRGRALTWEMFPFSFQEFLDWKGISTHAALSSAKRAKMRNAFDEYWESGGFPEAAGLESSLRVKTHQEYFQAIMYRDIVERHDVSHPKALSDLAHRMVDNTASLYSIARLSGYLKSLGHRVPRQTVSEYVQWFEDAYFLFSVPIFDASQARRNTNPRKIYCIDHGFVTSVSSGILVNSGHLLENLVFVSLRRNAPELYYYKTGSGKEVDFVVPERRKQPALIQVSESIAREDTREREISALSEAMEELGISESVLVTRSEEAELDTESGTVKVVPVWKFLLDWES